MRKNVLAMLLVSVSLSGFCQVEKMKNVSFSDVLINDNFWSAQIDKITREAIPVCINQTEVKTPRIRNFEKVARKQGEKHEGIYYDDSDVYKALEAIAYSLKNHPDTKLEAKADEWIDKIAAAQGPDGYLNTYYTLSGLDKRWSDMEKHEDYNAGHLIEAAVAYYNATGKRKLLEVAIRVADNLDSTFRIPNRHWVSGHEEIELALVKLYKTTGKSKYLDLADWYLQQRGHGYGKGRLWNDQHFGVKYCQDDVPVKEQRQIEGHAVRAMYLYTGAADVGAAKNDTGYMTAMESVWKDVVYRNMYLTGGIGSSGSNEGFGVDYDLPNRNAYCETCASVGMVIWNQRMNLLTGDAKYIDVLERSLYNGALDGVSLKGDLFFYGNPLAANGTYSRSEWFGTACCPSNISRLIESVGDYIYAASDRGVWINLFVGSITHVKLGKSMVKLQQETNYPWEGKVTISVDPDHAAKFPLHLRIPGWAVDRPVPGGTYFYVGGKSGPVAVKVNGQEVRYDLSKGYAVLEKVWRKGDKITIDFPMEIKKVKAIDQIEADRNKVALERGPLVYCVEGPDNAGKANNFIVPTDAVFTARFEKDLLNGVTVLTGQVPVFQAAADGSGIERRNELITAIPYYTWANRGKSTMQVWLPARVDKLSLNPETEKMR